MLWCDVVWCGALWYCVLWCGVLWCGVVDPWNLLVLCVHPHVDQTRRSAFDASRKVRLVVFRVEHAVWRKQCPRDHLNEIKTHNKSRCEVKSMEAKIAISRCGTEATCSSKGLHQAIQALLGSWVLKA